MRLNPSLERWVQAALIGPDQAEAIRAFERQNNRPQIARWAFRLGGLAILVGILSIVAANWSAIPDGVKLAVHFALNLGAVGVIVAGWRRGSDRLAEWGGLALAGLTLTLLALIGQIYQLQSADWVLPTLWLALVTPVLFVTGRSHWVAVFWALALAVVAGLLTKPMGDWLGPAYLFPAWPVAATAVLPALALWPRLAAARPDFAASFRTIGLLFTAVLACGLSFLWYVSTSELYRSLRTLADDERAAWWMAAPSLTVVAVIAAGLYALVRHAHQESDIRRAWAIGLSAMFVAYALPFVVPHGDSPWISALVFGALWAALGYAGMLAGVRWLGSLAVALIAIRIVVVYIEVFGTLLTTGIGLVISGVVVIAVTAGALRLHKRWVRSPEAPS